MKKPIFILLFSLIFGVSFQQRETLAESEDYLWHLDATKVSELHKLGIKGEGVDILVYDTGIDVERTNETKRRGYVSMVNTCQPSIHVPNPKGNFYMFLYFECLLSYSP